MKNIVVVTVVGIMILFLVGTISAAEIPTTQGDGFIQRIISSIRYVLHQTEMFTVYGREMECSIYPDTTVNLVNTLLHAGRDRYYFDKENSCGDSFFVNYYRGEPGNDQYLKEIYYKDGNAYVTDGDGKGSFYSPAYVECDASAYWDKKCYVEVYCCSQGACQSNNECGYNEECGDGHITNLFSNLGVCMSTEMPTHTTKVYECFNDGSVSDILDEVSSDSINWCSNSDKDNYLLPSGGSSGVCYTPQNQPCYAVGNGNGNGEGVSTGNQKGIKADDITTLSDSALKNSLCVSDKDCVEGDCLTQDYLIDRGYLTESKAKSTLTSFCSEGSIITLIRMFASRIGLAPDVCGWFRDDLDSYVNNYGYCITEIEERNFLEGLAFLDITGDKTVDGAIILGAGVLIIILIMSRLNFVREYEYVY